MVFLYWQDVQIDAGTKVMAIMEVSSLCSASEAGFVGAPLSYVQYSMRLNRIIHLEIETSHV